MKKEFKDAETLKKEIYEIATENINTAKDLYSQLVPPDNKNINILTLNAEQAVNCLKIVKENADSLLKLYSEINKNELGKKSNEFEAGIYDILDKMGAVPDLRQIN